MDLIDLHCRVIAFWWRVLILQYRVSFWLFIKKYGIYEYEEDEGYLIGKSREGIFWACDDGILYEGPHDLCRDYSTLLDYPYNSMTWLAEKLGYLFEWEDAWCKYSRKGYSLDCSAFETNANNIDIDGYDDN